MSEQEELELLELEAEEAASQQPLAEQTKQKQPSLFEAKTIAPGVVGVVNDLKAKGQDHDLSAWEGLKGGGSLALAGTSDVLGGGYRLAGALVPGLRGKTKDEATGQERKRTFTEALQNPAGSLTTPIDEAIDETEMPSLVKTALHIALGAAQGGVAGIAKGAAKGAAIKATAGARESIGKGAVKVADAVQNVRLGATTKDVLDGWTPRTLAKSRMNREKPITAYQHFEKRLAEMRKNATGLRNNSEASVPINSVIDDLEKEFTSKRFDPNREEVKAAIDDIKKLIYGQLERDGSLKQAAKVTRAPGQSINERASEMFRKQVKTMNSGIPDIVKPGIRKPLSELTSEEIQALAKSKEIGFVTKNGKPTIEYLTPDPVQAVSSKTRRMAPGGTEVPDDLQVSLMDANDIKHAIGEQSAFLHIAGKVKGDKSASAAEKVYTRFYSKLKNASDHIGPPDLQKINKEFSEIIPAQNVLLRAMNREELGQVLGRANMPVTKFGILRTIMKMTKTDRMAGLNSLGEKLQASGAADATQSYRQAIEQMVRQSAPRGSLKGALLGFSR